jgi:excisionase family DNA binding protein
MGYSDIEPMVGGGLEVLREPLLDARQAGRLLGIPRSSVYDYAKRGELPHVKIGRHLKGIRGDLERAVVQRRVGI